jgi:hypothetical protein
MSAPATYQIPAMKNSFLLRILPALCTALLLSQCANSTPQKRIERNPQLFSQLNSRDREMVSGGVIREGMTRDAVFLAWGRPDSVSVGKDRGKEVEGWRYVGQRPVQTMHMNAGFGWGGWGGGGLGWGGCGPYGWGGGPFWGGGPSVVYVPYTSGVVEFRSGHVTKWVTTQR